MNKRKIIALIISTFVVGGACAVYAQTDFYPPTLVVTKPEQPASGIVPSGALHVPFTSIDLTARGSDIVIDEITVAKSGVSDDGVFDDIFLLDGDGEEVADGSLDDEHVVSFSGPLHIPRDTTMRLTVAANMADDLAEFDGQTATFTITSVIAHGYVPVR